LSPLEYSQKQNDLIDPRYSATSEWMVESSELNNWLSGSNPELLLEEMHKYNLSSNDVGGQIPDNFVRLEQDIQL
jgi:hypothetical protein